MTHDEERSSSSMRVSISHLTTKEEIDNLRTEYLKEKDGINGHVVEFPLHFLEKENLGISFFSVENIVPEKNFT